MAVRSHICSDEGAVHCKYYMSNRLSRHSGMTLLELVVAVAIFSLVAAAAYAALSQGLVVQDSLQKQRRFWQRFETVFSLIHTDFEQAVELAPRNPVSNAFDGQGYGAASAYGHMLEFTRGVNTSYQRGAASPFRRVAYYLENSRLYRRVQARLDQPHGVEGMESLLIEDVKAIHLRYLGSADTWFRRWPQPLQPEELPGLPRAVEMTMELEGRGVFRWLFHVGPTR